DHLGNATIFAALMNETHLIDCRPVKIESRQRATYAVFEFVERAHTEGVAFAVRPQWQRSAPESFARQCPIDIVLQPIPEAAISDVGGYPVNGLVEFYHSITKRGRTNVPS